MIRLNRWGVIHAAALLLAAGTGWAQTTTAPATQPAESSTKPAANVIDQAEVAFFAGKYAEAISLAEAKLDDPVEQTAAAVIVARAHRMTGKYDQAVAVLEKLADQSAEDADWQVAMARALERLGRYEDVLAHAGRARTIAPDDPRGILLQGRTLETLGRYDEALEAYRGIEAILRDDSFTRNPAALVAMGQILDRYGMLTGERASRQAQNILHNYFQDAYKKVRKGYWPAHIAAGAFLLSKHKAGGAGQEFSLALKAQKNLPEAWAGLAAVDLNRWKFEDCLGKADKALAINPNLADAHLAKAACYMQWRKFDKVPPIVEKVLAVNPNHPEALALMAAAYIRMGEDAKAEPFAKRFEKVNPHGSLLAVTIGNWLVAGRQFDQARGYLDRAVELQPKLAEPYASLGQLYMQTGEEAQAIKVLDKAHEIDDFREDVLNYLQVARRLVSDEFLVRQTEHFIIKVNAEHDAVLLDQVAEFMEEVYDEVTSDYNYRPDRKIIVEVLPNQEQFSARISGRAWIPTIGACTGPVIAIAAPNKIRGQLGLHNWGEVLRHEFAHTVTLGATGNRIPHWFTEACAVWQQKDKRATKYVQALVNATRADGLLKVKDMDWSFIRPRKPGERMLAYCQSEWMLDYIIRTRGFETVHRMLAGFRDGKTQAEVFDEVLGMGESQFDEAFAKWAAEQVAAWGFPAEPLPKLAETSKAYKANAEDPNVLARHALALMYAGKGDRAMKVATAALEKNPSQIDALRVLANMQLKKGLLNAAIETANRLEALDPTTQTAPRILARCYLAKKDYPEAIRALHLQQQRSPMDHFSYKQLAKLYIQLGRVRDALPQLIYLHRHTLRDPSYARQAAEIYRTLGEYEAAEKFFREILRINPYESSAYAGLATLLLRQGEFDRARKAAEALTLLEPDSARSWSYLAMVEFRSGQQGGDVARLKQAREAALRSQQLDPAGQGKAILQYVDAAIESLDNSSP
jgi:cellulose synthase operon protein C